MSNASEYETKDLYVSAYLHMNGEMIVATKEISPGRFMFIFKQGDSLSKLVEQFYAKRALVDPMDFIVAIKTVKGKISPNTYNKQYISSKSEPIRQSE